MSRIPLSTNHRTADSQATVTAFPFPERATSPLPPQSSRHPSSMSAISGQSGLLSETRKKQSKRDEAIRRKIESELARKRTISTTYNQRSRRGGKNSAIKGTVAALKPSPALTVPESITIADASQLCAAKRTDCVLVVDEEEGLSGIFTAKDLAYRVSAEGIDPRSTPVSQIMTRNPMVTRDTTSATEALQLMVQRHFRHLPVCNEEGNVVGLLDITKVFHEALAKVERSSSASEKLYSALAGVQDEFGPGMATNPQAAAMLAYVEALREKTALPDLTTVMDSRTNPATVGPKTTVKDAAKLMKEHKTTAVCVMENTGTPGAPPRIAGIFTSKDVVLRVIAAGLDPARCSVVRVMTPHPDVVPPITTVQDALKKMHDGHYLNLPVMEDDGRLVAVVDVLTLTYATLEQMNAVSGDANNEPSSNPIWSRFFDSLGHDDNDSVISGSNVPTDVQTPGLYETPPKRASQSPEVYPHDSASAIDEPPVSNLDSVMQLQGNTVGHHSSVLGASAPIVDDGTFVFKFRTPSARTHRFQARIDDLENLRDIIAGKLSIDPFFTEMLAEEHADQPDPLNFQLSYTDMDGDVVLISSDVDVADAVNIAKKSGLDRVILLVTGGKEWDKAGAQEAEATAEKMASVAKEQEKVIDSIDVPPTTTFSEAPPSKVHVSPVTEEVFGIPKDLLLPASIGALAVVILGVFTISRFSSRY